MNKLPWKLSNEVVYSKEQREQQVKIYGVTVNELVTMVQEDGFSEPKMLVLSLLSDAQEQIAFGQPEVARQTVNRAKWVIRYYMDVRE